MIQEKGAKTKEVKLCVFAPSRLFLIFNYQLSIFNYLKSGRIDDVMKTPFKKDLRTPRLCNPSAFQLS